MNYSFSFSAEHKNTWHRMIPTVAMETDASHMLEAALEQMDDIIAGNSQKP